MRTQRSRIIANTINWSAKDQSRSLTKVNCKRVFDLILGVTALLIAAPVMMVIALLLWLESPGHVIFAQQRLGQYGKRFTLYKFRKFPALWKSEGPSVTVSNDARLTTIGWVLERTKLDELPQLWNILKGDMSFVGPRPESPRFVDLFVGRYRGVLDYLPGLFGPSSVRNECHLYPPDEDPEMYYRRVLFPQKSQRDLNYYPRANLLSDSIWIVKGVWETIAGVINWKRLIRSHGVVILADALSVEIGWILVNVFRFAGLPPGGGAFQAFLVGFWIFPIFFVACALAGRCYRYPKRHFSFDDGIRLLTVFSIAWMSGCLVLLGITRSVSLYLVPMGWFVLFSLIAFGRIAFRIRAQRLRFPQQQYSRKVLIYGVNSDGIKLAEWIKGSSTGIRLAGFLEDDGEQCGQRVSGIGVLGCERDLPTIQSVYQVQEIWLSFMPDRKKRYRLNSFCKQHGIRLVVFPELEPFKRLLAPRYDANVRSKAVA